MASLELDIGHLWPSFGRQDVLGLVGESPAIWELRHAIARAAQREEHTLILGPSGAGKELTARGVHRLSRRSNGPWIAHNAAAIPEGLLTAELFGNRQSYPNPGTPEREGLIGAAHRGVLMLDEVGELSTTAQATLLRVLDREGHYQRLGESHERQSDLRVIGATHQPLDALRADFAARFPLRLTVPGLASRREDIPLLCRHLLTEMGIERTVGEGLLRALINAPFTTHVRELKTILMAANEATAGQQLSTPPGWPEGRSSPPKEGASLTATAIRQALAAHFGNREATATALGLSSRYVLYRLMKVHGIKA